MKTNWPAFRFGCLILATVALGASPATLRGQDATAVPTSAAVISSVAITQDTQRAAVRVEGAGRLDVHAARMQNPERLVLDFAGARMGVQKSSIPGVAAPVRGVRVGQFRPDVARIVIDLTASAPYQIAHEGAAIVIYFQAQNAPAEGKLVAPVTSTSVEKTPQRISYVPSAPRASARSGKALKEPAPRFGLPNELTQPSIVLASLKERSEPARPAGNTQSGGQIGLNYVPATFTTTAAMVFSNNTWNYTGAFISGFDFTRADGRDADFNIENNAGIEDKNPNCKINVVNNASTTSCVTAGNWYKANWTNTSSITTKFLINNNRVTYQSRNTRSMYAIVSGNVSVNIANENITIGIVKNGITGTRYGETTLRTVTANQPFQYSTVILLSDVIKNDYFELYVSAATGGHLLIFQDVNIYVDSK